MTTNKTIIAFVCSCSLIANPMMAADKSCCCGRSPVGKSTCRHSLKPDSAKPARTSCCHQHSPAKNTNPNCDCCCKPETQAPVQSSAPSHLPLDFGISAAIPFIPPTGEMVFARRTTNVYATSGPALLALLCKWLK
jgi:hypothetical protein